MTYHRGLDAAWGRGDEIASPDFCVRCARRWPMAEASGTILVSEIIQAEWECASVVRIEG
jgi:hypothetical protein